MSGCSAPIPPEFWGCPLDEITDVGAPRSEGPRLISREIICELFNLCAHSVPELHRETDRRTDGRTD